MELEDVNRAELHLRQLAAVAGKYTTGWGLNEITYEKVKPALDEDSKWTAPDGRRFTIGYITPTGKKSSDDSQV